MINDSLTVLKSVLFIVKSSLSLGREKIHFPRHFKTRDIW